MTARLSTLQSRFLAVGLLLLSIVAVAAAVAIPALLLHRHYDSALAELTDRLQRFRRVAAQQPEWARLLEDLKSRDATRFTLKNQATNLAAAELQDKVREAIESNGGRIVTIQTPPPREEGVFRQVGVNVQLFANTSNLQKILFTIESQVPHLFVDNVSMRATAFRGFRPNPGVEPEVSVQADVSAFVYPAGGRK
jgi:general secretion pathway protein M